MIPDILANAESELTNLAREAIAELHDLLVDLDRLLVSIDKKLDRIFRFSEVRQRIARIKGVGPKTATAVVAAIGDGSEFKNGRHLAAWIGLVPRQPSSGRRTVLLCISKRRNQHLRMPLVHGARAAVCSASSKRDPFNSGSTSHRKAYPAQARYAPPVALGHKAVTDVQHALSAEPLMANHVIDLLSGMYNLAEHRGKIPKMSNPCSLVAMNREGKRNCLMIKGNIGASGRCGTTRRLARESRCMSHAMATMHLLMLTDCRKGEVLKLRWDQVDPGGRGDPFAGKQDGAPYDHAALEDMRLHSCRHSSAFRASAHLDSVPAIGRVLGPGSCRQPQCTRTWGRTRCGCQGFGSLTPCPKTLTRGEPCLTESCGVVTVIRYDSGSDTTSQSSFLTTYERAKSGMFGSATMDWELIDE